MTGLSSSANTYLSEPPEMACEYPAYVEESASGLTLAEFAFSNGIEWTGTLFNRGALALRPWLLCPAGSR
jgi:hypothetical protein